MSARELPTGIFQTSTGYRTVVRVGPGPSGLKSKRWKTDATLTEMRQWREDERVEARRPKPAAPPPVVLVGFAAHALRYLDTVPAMTSYKERVKHIGEWIALFGDEPMSAVTAARIRAKRDRWLTVGPKRVLEKVKGQKAQWTEKAVPLSASSVNNRLRALENMFTVLWPGTPNPVRDVPEAEAPDPEPRGYSFAIALEVLSFMPDITKPKKNETHEPGSLSRARFEAMLWTGLPAVQLARLKPELVDWVAGTILVPSRQKGRKSRRARRRREHPRPLMPQAVVALKRFFALNANRKFSSSSLGKSVKSAIRAANVVRADKQLPPIPETATVYDLTRHTFGTEAMRACRNLKAVQDLMGHADINQTSRYAMAAVTEGTLLAVQQLAAHARRGRQPSGNLSRVKVSRLERSQRRRVIRNAE